MGIVLTDHQYGKAETRVVRVVRDTERHELRDLNVSSALRGRFEAAYLSGDQSAVLPTDTQKNTVFAFAKSHGIEQPESFGLALARHFVESIDPVEGARIDLEEFAWDRALVDGAEHDHTWVRRGPEVRTAAVTVDASGEHVIGGVRDLVLLKSTGSAFEGFLEDEYTTLEPTDDRVMATSIVAAWRFRSADADWDAAFATVRRVLIERFAALHSLALQQSLWHMGRAALDAVPELVEVRLAAPNKHHFAVDLAPFGLENRNEVFFAADRPYGLIEAVVARDDAPPAGRAWSRSAGAS